MNQEQEELDRLQEEVSHHNEIFTRSLEQWSMVDEDYITSIKTNLRDAEIAADALEALTALPNQGEQGYDATMVVAATQAHQLAMLQRRTSFRAREELAERSERLFEEALQVYNVLQATKQAETELANQIMRMRYSSEEGTFAITRLPKSAEPLEYHKFDAAETLRRNERGEVEAELREAMISSVVSNEKILRFHARRLLGLILDTHDLLSPLPAIDGTTVQGFPMGAFEEELCLSGWLRHVGIGGVARRFPPNMGSVLMILKHTMGVILRYRDTLKRNGLFVPRNGVDGDAIVQVSFLRVLFDFLWNVTDEWETHLNVVIPLRAFVSHVNKLHEPLYLRERTTGTVRSGENGEKDARLKFGDSSSVLNYRYTQYTL